MSNITMQDVLYGARPVAGTYQDPRSAAFFKPTPVAGTYQDPRSAAFYPSGPVSCTYGDPYYSAYSVSRPYDDRPDATYEKYQHSYPGEYQQTYDDYGGSTGGGSTSGQ